MRMGLGLGLRFAKPTGGFNPFNISGTTGMAITFNRTKAQFTDLTSLDFADTDNDVVTVVRDGSDLALRTTTYGSPTLQSDAVMGSYLAFPSGNSQVVFLGSKSALRNLHTNKTWDLAFWVKVTTLQSCTFFDSTRRTGGSTGIFLDLQSSGKIRFWITNGSGSAVYSKDTDATLPTGEWVLIRCKHEIGQAPTIQLFTNNGQTAQTEEALTAGAGSYVANGTNSTDDLVFGSRSNSIATSVYDDDLGGILLKLDSLFTDAELLGFRNWRAVRESNAYNLRTKGNFSTLGARAISGLIADHFLGDTTKLWQDSIGGTAADDDTDPIGIVQPQWDGVADSTLARELTASGGDRPIFKLAGDVGLSVGGGLWNKATPNSLDIPATARGYPGTQCYRLYLIRSTVADDGSRYETETSSSYLTVTGPDYVLGSGQDERAVWHTTDSSNTPVYGTENGSIVGGTEIDGNGWLIIEALRDGTDIWLAINGVDMEPLTTTTGTYDPDQMGDGEGTDNYGGYIVRRIAYNGLPTPAQREALRAWVMDSVSFGHVYSRPVANVNTVWTLNPYTQADFPATQPDVPDTEDAIAATAGGYGVQSYDLADPGIDATTVKVWLYMGSGSSPPDLGISLTINGEETETIEVPSTTETWQSATFTGNWSAADFATQFQLNLDSGVLTGGMFVGASCVYAEVIP